jgi:hypothetical protein
LLLARSDGEQRARQGSRETAGRGQQPGRTWGLTSWRTEREVQGCGGELGDQGGQQQRESEQSAKQTSGTRKRVTGGGGGHQEDERREEARRQGEEELQRCARPGCRASGEALGLARTCTAEAARSEKGNRVAAVVGKQRRLGLQG